MLEVDNIAVSGFEPAIRGMRNPMNSWGKLDSVSLPSGFRLGENDKKLAMSLVKAGASHCKFRRMITCTMDILAPLYWLKEFDTYKVGTVSNSCSTMHKIHSKEFTLKDFSTENMGIDAKKAMLEVIDVLNKYRDLFNSTGNKTDWYSMIQLLPSSYNQLRTVMLSYETLASIYATRKGHKLDEWRKFCAIIKRLPNSEIITGEEK